MLVAVEVLVVVVVLVAVVVLVSVEAAAVVLVAVVLVDVAALPVLSEVGFIDVEDTVKRGNGFIGVMKAEVCGSGFIDVANVVVVGAAVYVVVSALTLPMPMNAESIPLVSKPPRRELLIGSWAIDISWGKLPMPCPITLEMDWNVSSLY